jgi:hypothetical protein
LERERLGLVEVMFRQVMYRLARKIGGFSLR